MPYLSEKIIIAGTVFDKRIKLTGAEKDEIRKRYALGETSHNKLAKLYGVSKRLISFIVNPGQREENYQRRVANGGSTLYYDKNKQREYIKEYRHHKQELYLEGKIK